MVFKTVCYLVLNLTPIIQQHWTGHHSVNKYAVMLLCLVSALYVHGMLKPIAKLLLPNSIHPLRSSWNNISFIGSSLVWFKHQNNLLYTIFHTPLISLIFWLCTMTVFMYFFIYHYVFKPLNSGDPVSICAYVCFLSAELTILLYNY